jgi:hypothetical protein
VCIIRQYVGKRGVMITEMKDGGVEKREREEGKVLVHRWHSTYTLPYHTEVRTSEHKPWMIPTIELG